MDHRNSSSIDSLKYINTQHLQGDLFKFATRRQNGAISQLAVAMLSKYPYEMFYQRNLKLL